jgi:aminoglycoside phosphotransferase family enzyme/predicted kinase
MDGASYRVGLDVKRAPRGTTNPSHTVADQSEVFAFMADARSHGLSEGVHRLDTHGAAVFLAGPNAYKIKRAVLFPFMDYSTLEKRKAACEAEIEVNRGNAPALYLGVVPITRAGGRLQLGGQGDILEWAVHMRRFDETQTLDVLAQRGGFSTDLLARLTNAICGAHQRAPTRDGPSFVQCLARYLDQNEQAFGESPELFVPSAVGELTRKSRNALSAVEQLLLERGRAGYVRRCHGDLHLRNIVLLEREPVLFDAVEFDDAIATGDVLYDLAFLLMDLRERALSRDANTVLNRYLWASDEAHLSGLAAMPLFLSIRAAIRAKVVAGALPYLSGPEREARAEEAGRYFKFAQAFLAPVASELVAIGGLSGTGKSTLAAALAPHLGRPPGAVHLRSDIVRKRMLRVPEAQRLDAKGYAKEVSEKVYSELRRQAAMVLRAGYAVVFDAVHEKEADRRAAEELAAALRVPFRGYWLEAPLEVLFERVSRRVGDASDADRGVVRAQWARGAGPISWAALDAALPVEVNIEAMIRSTD